MNEERTWTGNSEVDAAIVMLDRIDCSPKDNSRIDAVETTLRRLYARNQELEARLQKLQSYYDAVGAGGVSAQRITQVAPQPQADARDAERWRFIKRKLCLTCNGDGTCAMQALNLPARILGWPDVGELAIAQFLDAAIDAAIAAAKEI